MCVNLRVGRLWTCTRVEVRSHLLPHFGFMLLLLQRNEWSHMALQRQLCVPQHVAQMCSLGHAAAKLSACMPATHLGADTLLHRMRACSSSLAVRDWRVRARADAVLRQRGGRPGGAGHARRRAAGGRGRARPARRVAPAARAAGHCRLRQRHAGGRRSLLAGNVSSLCGVVLPMP